MLHRVSAFVLALCMVMGFWVAQAAAQGYIKVRVAPGCAGEEYIFACWDCYGGDLNWDFGDGGRANGGQVSHVFERPGTYTVKLSIDWVGFIDADGDGEKEYYTPDGTVDEVLTTTVTVQDCSQPESEEEQEQPASSGNATTTVTGSADTGTVEPLTFDLRCGDYGRVGQPVTCVAEWDRSRTVTVYYTFSAPVEINGNVVTRIAHLREVTFIPQTSGTLYVEAKAYDLNSDARALDHAIIHVAVADNQTAVEEEVVALGEEEDAAEGVTAMDNGTGKGYIKVRVNPGCAGQEYIFACWDCYGGDLEWDFGDGTGANGGQVNHVFRRPGDYVVTLRIDWVGFIDADGDGRKEYYRPDGHVDEVKQIVVHVGECTEEEAEEPRSLVAGDDDNATAFTLDVRCTDRVRVGEPITCVADWDHRRTVATYWTFSAPVGRVLDGKEVYVREIKHTRTFTVNAVEPGELAITLTGYDMNTNERAQATVRVVVAEEAPAEADDNCTAGNWTACADADACAEAGGVWYGERCVAADEAACLMSGGLFVDGSCETCADNFTLCRTEEDCVAVGGYWVNGACAAEPPVARCDVGTLWACESQEACEEVGGRWDVELGCLDVRSAEQVQCERAGGEFNKLTGACVYVKEAHVDVALEEDEDGGRRLHVKADVKNVRGRCYYVAAYVPALDQYFFLGGNNVISEEPVPAFCEPGHVELPLLELKFEHDLGLDVKILQGFYNEETGEFEDIEPVADFEL